MAKQSTKNTLKVLPSDTASSDAATVVVDTMTESDIGTAPTEPPDLSDEMKKTIAGATFFPATMALSTPRSEGGGHESSALQSVMKKIEEIFVPVPTAVTFNAILGRFRIDEKEHVGDRNGTRWIADIELEGSTAVDLKIELLAHGTGAPIVPPLVSYTLGAGHPNFYVARPYIVQEKGELSLRTVALKASAKVKFRLAIDTYHSANR